VHLLNQTRKPQLCYVTDRRALRAAPDNSQSVLLGKIAEATQAGLDWIQLREKGLDGRELSALTARTVELSGPYCQVLLNDRLDVASASGAAGVHLGEQSIPVAEAVRFRKERRLPDEFLIGASVHSLGGALAAEKAGASYIVFGPVFDTPSKSMFGEPQGIDALKLVCGGVSIPVLAIGGITLENVEACIQAGAQGIAAIRLFQDAKDLRGVTQKLRALGTLL